MNTSYLLVVISGIISGLIVFGGQVLARLGFSLFQISTLPYIFCLLLLAPLFFYKKSKNIKEFFPLLLFYGFIESGIVFCQFAAPFLGASVAITVLLLYVQPLWTTIASRIFLKEKITVINFISCILVLAGVVLIVDPFGIKNIGSLAGIGVATLGGIFLSGWVSVGSLLSKKGVKPTDTMFIGSAFMTAIMFVLFPILGLFIKDHTLTSYSLDKGLLPFIVIFSFGVITFIVNHFVYLQGTKKVPTADAGIIMLLEPVVGTLLAIVFFHQLLTINIVIGGVLILFANYLVIVKGRKE
jgi:drug/metabolite transporter (DMT)-like permease